MNTPTKEQLQRAFNFYRKSPDGQWDDVATWAIEKALEDAERIAAALNERSE